MGVVGRGFTVTITLLDGSQLAVHNVDRLQDRERVLRLYQDLSSYGWERKHLGSWPFESIRSWKVQEQE